ncbi:hypothetical protein [Brevundimonas sp.]|uniref:hypothetical protein n=1 Tax=Brevundimonas sp. TaxID=1871086 RepID=UPI002737FAF2|nr:hypothetical protein [Brevundimonas sp.]MDP3802605.1 hypothetical protein [Brevundimonas sp.]
MLVEPEADAGRLALDRAVMEAVRARLAAGPRPTPDADAIAMRDLLDGLSPPEASAARAVLGRIDAVHRPPLVVWGPASQTLAADRFGLVARAVAGPEQALAAVRDGARALMDVTAATAWWGRLLAEPDLRVVAALPDDRHGVPRALMIQRAQSGPTGDDRTFWVTDSPAPNARIVQALGAAGLAADPLIAAGGLKLFMLAGYVQAEDGRLASAPGSLGGVIGAAPQF